MNFGIAAERLEARRGYLFAGVMLISFSMLSYEIILTRIFSVMLSHAYVFAIVSFALFGLGVGGFAYHRWGSRYQSHSLGRLTTYYSTWMIISVIAIIRLPIYNNPLFIDLRVWVYIFFATITFLFAGLLLSAIFQEFAEKSSLIYGFDLLGAALGVLASVMLLNVFGGVLSAILVAGVSFFGALLLAAFEKKFLAGGWISLGIYLLLVGWVSIHRSALEVPVAMDPDKDMYRLLNHSLEKGEILESRWSAFGRTDLVKTDKADKQLYLFIDGAAGSPMYNLQAVEEDPQFAAKLLHHFGGAFPFFFLKDGEKDSALIIGPGGGRDAVVAMLGGVGSITAVEVNPAVVDLVKKYEAFNGGIYTKFPNIRVVVQEGRNYLRNSETKYDLIMLSLPIIKSSRSLEAFALTENYLFTIEAMEEYWEHLTSEGRLILVTHGEVEIYRLLNLYLEMNRRRGIAESESMKHAYTLANPLMPTLVIQKQPFDSASAALRHEMLHRLGYDRGRYFIPFVEQLSFQVYDEAGFENEWFMFDQILVGLSDGKLNSKSLAKSSVFDISVVTDDRPFFYDFQKGLPGALNSFVLFVILAMGFVLSPLIFSSKFPAASKTVPITGSDVCKLKIFLLLFFLLGTGYMFLEISMIQKLTLYFPHPVYALSTIIFSLLVGTGLGSFSSNGIKKRYPQTVALAGLVVALLSGIYLLNLDRILASLQNPMSATALMMSSLGFFMGFPFPLSIRAMKQEQLSPYIGWMWGINGVASVMGSTLAVIFGNQLGFSFAIYAGATVYIVVGLFSLILMKLCRKATITLVEEVV